MKKKKANRRLRSLPLALPMTIEQAIELTRRVPLRAVLSGEHKTISGVLYGPYWWAFFRRNGVAHREYVGLESKRDELEAAHAMVRAELARERAKLSPEALALFELEELLTGEHPVTKQSFLKKTDPVRRDAPGSVLGTTHPSRREAAR
jgi:hypothetical protein